MSGLEPLVALGLVCNIVQLVQVGLKTATLCKNAYRTGEPDPELSVYAQNLAVTASSLSQSLENSQQPINLDDSRLLALACNCRDAEAEWRKKTPARFLSQQQLRKRDRFGAVFRGIINKSEIDRLESRLQKARESLETGLLVGIFQRLDVSKVQANDLQDKFRDLLQATSTSEQKLHDLTQAQVALVNTQLSDRLDKAESSTKAHITSELGNHESRIISNANKGNDSLLTEAEVREASRRENEAYERLLRSFHYPDMNHRKNEIHRRHESTFNWIFKETTADADQMTNRGEPDSLLANVSSTSSEQQVCGGLARWLRSPEKRYWISGRPGTGKSVLMKFIISDKQTIDSLRQWQPGVRTLTHFFWKVGNPMQSSFKGFLCSLVYQIFSLDREDAMTCLQNHPDLSRKAAPGDWDSEDLQSLITGYLSLPNRPFCLFIDGLDELFDNDGVGTLIGFLDSLQRSSPTLKICMSSRPEHIIRMRLCRDPDLKMQNLTRGDIEQYSRATLEKEISLTTSSIDIEGIIRAISLEAQGVFLWAVLVTRSIARGIVSGDSSDDMQQRLRKTPKKLHELYLDMWTRLGEDSDLHRSSTALIFKLILFTWQSSQKFPVYFSPFSTQATSILDLMLASSEDLWSTPVNHVDRLSSTDLERRCQKLFTRLPFITADLLEVVEVIEYERPDETRWADMLQFPILRYHNLQVRAIHRTVFDFLLETEDGKTIMGHNKASEENLFIRIFKSCLLRDVLWPEVCFYPNNFGQLQRNEGDRSWYLAGRRLDALLKELSHHADIIHGSILVEMLDLVWASFVQMTKNFPSHLDPGVGDGAPICKMDYLLRVAPRGFDVYMRDDLIEWENTRQFDRLYQVAIACLGPGIAVCTNFSWDGRQRLIERILCNFATADRLYISLPNALGNGNGAMSKAIIAGFLISAVGTFCLQKYNPSASNGRWWNAHKTKSILKMIIDFRHSLCLGDHMLVTLHLTEGLLSFSDVISYERHRDFQTAIYVEISMSILLQIFLRQVVKDDAVINCHEFEDVLNLKAFPQTLRPVMLGVKEDFLEISSTDLPHFQSYCQVRLLPELFSASSEELEVTKWYKKRIDQAWRDMIESQRHTGTQAETPRRIGEGIGPHGMNFYPCDACKARERT